ncbi:unnamed protein product [Mytilus edulis]|uniref:DZIP3-like HEPN domain-containing protein n=1 Tax=Mytilus edulis TaxID=6550 RepID=A0A8S3UH12_MYTED|nr:unnamed protein product [Mytilus edulis]
MTEFETSNYIKILLLVFTISRKAVRKKFDYEFDPKVLHETLRSSKKTLTRLQQGKHINKDQLKSITQSEASSADFDLTLMIILLKNLADIPIGDELPVHGNTSKAADITRIKFYRNFIAHNTDAAICEVDFKSYWADIEQAVLRLSDNTLAAECEKLKLQEFQPTEIGKCLKILSRLGDLEENQSHVTQEIADMKIN